MIPQRVVLSETTTSTLRALTQKTGLSANIISRFAMLISFEMPDVVVPETGKAGLTINRSTLFGELEAFLMSAYALTNAPGQGSVGKVISGHIARGAAFLNVRVE